MRVICAWCGCELERGDEPASHGICPACFGRLKATLRAGSDAATTERPVVEMGMQVRARA